VEKTLKKVMCAMNIVFQCVISLSRSTQCSLKVSERGSVEVEPCPCFLPLYIWPSWVWLIELTPFLGMQTP